MPLGFDQNLINVFCDNDSRELRTLVSHSSHVSLSLTFNCFKSHSSREVCAKIQRPPVPLLLSTVLTGDFETLSARKASMKPQPLELDASNVSICDLSAVRQAVRETAILVERQELRL